MKIPIQLKFFLDANIPYSSITIFKKFNYSAEHARNIGMGNSLDNEIIEYAIKRHQILVTKDLGFGNTSKAIYYFYGRIFVKKDKLMSAFWSKIYQRFKYFYSIYITPSSFRGNRNNINANIHYYKSLQDATATICHVSALTSFLS